MSKREKLVRHILESRDRNPSDCIFYSTIQLANEFGVPEPEVREVLIQAHEDRLTYLAVWDSSEGRPREREFRKWSRSADAFFISSDDKGYVRVTVLPRGSELLAEIAKAPIGFAPV